MATTGLRLLRAADAPAILDFERANRAFFAASVSDRGDEFFAQYAERHADLLAAQEAGTTASYLLLSESGNVLGRFNLYAIGAGTAELGYRVAQHATGQGVATTGVRELCDVAAERHGVGMLRAAASDRNVASQRVLARCGFTQVGPAVPADLGGKPGSWWEKYLGAHADRAAAGP